jgi:hypothetical protein
MSDEPTQLDIETIDKVRAVLAEAYGTPDNDDAFSSTMAILMLAAGLTLGEDLKRANVTQLRAIEIAAQMAARHMYDAALIALRG